METNVLLIINPNSGDGEAKRWVYDMAEAFLRKYDFVTVYFSKKQGDIIKVVSEKAGLFDTVVCSGGDGTLNETVTGIVRSGQNPKLGYIPTGTVNDFATSHKIPKGIKEAIDNIINGKDSSYDVGKLAERPFTYVAAFGAFTDVAYSTPQISKASFGKSAYIAEGIKRLSSLGPIKAEITAGCETVMGDFIYGMVANSKTVGGFKFFESDGTDSLRDGKLDLLLIRYPENPQQFQEAISGLLVPKTPTSAILRLSAEEISFHFPDKEISFTVDGEFGGTYQDVKVSCLHERLRIIE